MDAIANIIARLRISDDRLLGKSREYLQLLHINLPPPNLKKSECARYAIAIEFACKSLQINYDRDSIVNCSMLSNNEYKGVFLKCKNICQLDFFEFQNVLDILVIHCGGHTHIKAVSLKVLALYQERYVDKLAQSQNVDLRKSEYQAAAFKLACKIAKIPFDRKNLLALCGLNGSYFDRVYESIAVSFKSTVSSFYF
jgi:hypothetical protein